MGGYCDVGKLDIWLPKMLVTLIPNVTFTADDLKCESEYTLGNLKVGIFEKSSNFYGQNS